MINLLILSFLVFTFIFLFYVYFKISTIFAKGELIQTICIENRLVLVTSLHQESGGGLSSTARGSYYIRLTIVDTETGDILGKKIISPQFEIRMVVNGIIWFSLNRARYQERADQELIGLDLFTIQKVFDQNKIKQALGIMNKESFHSMNFDINTGVIAIVDSNGFCHNFDCNTMNSNGSSNHISLPSEGELYNPLLRLDRFHFEKMLNSERYILNYNENTIAENQTYINPLCLFTSFHSSGNDALVFFHQKDLNGQTESYISVMGSNDPIHTVIQVLEADQNKKIAVRKLGKVNSKIFISTQNAKQNLILAIDTTNARLSWVCKY